MLDKLVASAPGTGMAKGIPSATLSALFHSAVIYAGVQATMGAGQRMEQTAMDTNLVFIQEEEEQEEEQAPEIKLEEVGFTVLLAPVAVPTNIPPINLNERFDPRDFTGVGRERPISEILAGPATAGPGEAYAEALVEEKPEIISAPPLRYPELLRQAGIEGFVMVEVVVDTTGRAEPASLRVVESSNRAFEVSATEAVGKTIYRPGRMYGQRVRVLVQVPVTFSIRKSR